VTLSHNIVNILDGALRRLSIRPEHLEAEVRRLREFKQRVEDDLNAAGVSFGMVARTVEEREAEILRLDEKALALEATVDGLVTEHDEVRGRARVEHPVLVDVDIEMGANLIRWGVQDYPDVSDLQAPGLGEQFARDAAADRAQYWKLENGRRDREGALSWDGVLLEETYEALAEADPVKLKAELVQVAAVAAQWIEAIDRRLAASEEQAA